MLGIMELSRKSIGLSPSDMCAVRGFLEPLPFSCLNSSTLSSSSSSSEPWEKTQNVNLSVVQNLEGLDNYQCADGS